MFEERETKKFFDHLEQILHNPQTSKDFGNEENGEILHTAQTVVRIMEPTTAELEQLESRFFAKAETAQVEKKKPPRKKIRLRPWLRNTLIGLAVLLLLVGIFSVFPNLLRRKTPPSAVPGSAAEPTSKLGYNYSDGLYLISLKDYSRELVSRDPAANGYEIRQWNGVNEAITPLLSQRDQQNVLVDIAADGRTGIIETTGMDHLYGEKTLKVYDFLDRSVFAEFPNYLREGQWLDTNRFVFIEEVNGEAQLMLYDLSTFTTDPLSPTGLNVLRYVGEDNGWFYWQAGVVVYDDDGKAEITPADYWRSTANGELEAVWDSLSGLWLTKNPRSAQLAALPQECVLLQTNNYLQGCEQLTFLDFEGNLLANLPLNGGIKEVFFAPDGRQLLAAVRLAEMENEPDRVVWVNLNSGETLLLGSAIRLNVFPMENEFKREPAWSPDGKLVILGGKDGLAPVVWSPEKNFMRSLEINVFIKSIFWKPQVGNLSAEEWANGEFDPEWTLNINEEPLTLKHINLTDQAIEVTLCTRTAVNLVFFGNGIYAHYHDNDLYLQKISDDYNAGSGQETACAQYLAVRPSDWGGGDYQIVIDSLVAQGATVFGDEQFETKVEEKEQIKIRLDKTDSGTYQVNILEKPQGMSNNYARQLVEYDQHLVKEGPWVFSFRLAQEGLFITHPNQVDPAVCSGERYQVYGREVSIALDLADVETMVENGTKTLGDTLYEVWLVCNYFYTTEDDNPRYKSEINQLGILIHIQTGEGEDSEHMVWMLPFTPIDKKNPNVAIESMVGNAVWNFGFPVKGDSDVLFYDEPIQYVIALTEPTQEQAALLYSFSLTSSVDGFHPEGMKLSVLSAEELQTLENQLETQAETLLANITSMDSLIESVSGAMQQAIDPYEFTNGWVHQSFTIQQPGGNENYDGLTDYQYEMWEYLRAGEVVRSVTDYQSDQGKHLELVMFNNDEVHNLSRGELHQPKTSYPFQFDPSLINKLTDYRRAGFEVQPQMASWNGRWVWQFVFDQEPGKISKIYFDLQRGLVVGIETFTNETGSEPQLIERRTLTNVEEATAPDWVFDALRLNVDDPAAVDMLLNPDAESSLPFDPADVTISLVPYPSQTDMEYWNGEVYAGETLLGVVNFGDKPEDACTRSNSGKVVSFVYRKVIDDQFSVSELHWFFVHNLNMVHQPKEDMLIFTPVFWSPVEDSGVFFACETTNHCGIFILDTETNQIRLLFDQAESYRNIIWGPDGSQIAFIGFSQSSQIYTLYVVDVISGEAVWSGLINFGSWTIPPDSPAADWGMKFSDVTYGDCFTN